MVDLIEIIIKNGVNEKIKAMIFPKDNTYFYNTNKYSITNEKINKLLRIFSLWKYEYGVSNVIDAEEFTVKVTSNNKITTYHGKGIYPRNYEEFLLVLGEI